MISLKNRSCRFAWASYLHWLWTYNLCKMISMQNLVVHNLVQGINMIKAALKIYKSLWPTGFSHGLRHSFPEFLQRFHFSPFSSGIIRFGLYNYFGAATDSWSRTCSLPTYDFSVPAANLKRLQPSPQRFCVSVVLISPVSNQCPATMLSLLSSQAEPCYGRLAALLAMEGLSESVLMSKFRTSHLF